MSVPRSASGVFTLPNGRLVSSLSKAELRGALGSRGKTGLSHKSTAELRKQLRAVLAATPEPPASADEAKASPPPVTATVST